jgi:hypothetical protein
MRETKEGCPRNAQSSFESKLSLKIGREEREGSNPPAVACRAKKLRVLLDVHTRRGNWARPVVTPRPAFYRLGFFVPRFGPGFD